MIKVKITKFRKYYHLGNIDGIKFHHVDAPDSIWRLHYDVPTKKWQYIHATNGRITAPVIEAAIEQLNKRQFIVVEDD